MRRRSRHWIAAMVAIAATSLALWWSQRPSETPVHEPLHTAVNYVGPAACAACHAGEIEAWQGSHHDRAMQVANERSVLGNFDNATFQYAGITSTFSKRNGNFFVSTDGPDGRLSDYEIKYTFGVTPLQQYLIEFPGGRMQALPIAWDTRPKDKGGQRWFHLYPSERITHEDELHWTRPQQNWNFMCADCHSTNLKKNYDATSHTFKTTWSEVNVSCEACHGPGSRHVEWALRAAQGLKKTDTTKGLTVSFRERHAMRWTVQGCTTIFQSLRLEYGEKPKSRFGFREKNAPLGQFFKVPIFNPVVASRPLVLDRRLGRALSYPESVWPTRQPAAHCGSQIQRCPPAAPAERLD